MCKQLQSMRLDSPDVMIPRGGLVSIMCHYIISIVITVIP